MKRIMLIIIISMLFSSLFSQESNSKLSFKILIGAKYTPIDYIGGGILGFSIIKNNFGFSFRNDISLSITKEYTSVYYGINEYRTHKYLDFHYFFNNKLSSSLGYGWISHKDEAFLLLRNRLGYSVISLGINYLITQNIIIEFKGDIPFVDLNSPVDEKIAFPASIGLIYTLH